MSLVSTLLDEIGDRPYIGLGEASHGTAEFNETRLEIARNLIETLGFNFVVVEWDWTDCFRVNEYVKGYSNAFSSAEEVLSKFSRWPQWMWGNQEVADFIEWLRDYNRQQSDVDKVGFYGFDLFGLQSALAEVESYLKGASTAETLISSGYSECARNTRNNEQGLTPPCEKDLLSSKAPQIIKSLKNQLRLRRPPADAPLDIQEDYMNANMCVFVIEDNIKHQLAMIHDPNMSSWNIRENHMLKTFQRLLDFYREYVTAGNSEPKAIILSHNTHIGDTSYSDMPSNLSNLAQLLRKEYGDDVFLVGFMTYEGNVLAGADWGGPNKVMKIPPADRNSWEYHYHQELGSDGLILSSDPSDGRRNQNKNRLHRAIGAVYNPRDDRNSYAPVVLIGRYDAVIYFEFTNPTQPIMPTD